MPSPTLHNSAFASLNLFPSAPTHAPRYSPSLEPRFSPSGLGHRPIPKRASSKSINPPIIPARGSSFGLELDNSSPSTPDLSYYLEPTSEDAQSPTVFIPLDSPTTPLDMSPRPFSVIDLGSPCAISNGFDAEAMPSSVHVGKQRMVNWARPFQGVESASDLQIFGQSAQRARRMKKSHSANAAVLSFPSPTPSSSDDEPLPLTPSIDMNRAWSVTTGLTGLGVKGLKEFDSLDLGEIHLDTPITSPASSVIFSITPPSSIKRRAAPPARLLDSSQSLDSLAAPSNLAELRQLQQAAVDLQYEARRPFKLNLPTERRIRRKAVPSVPADSVDWTKASGSGSSYTLQVITPEVSPSVSGSSELSSVDEVFSEQLFIAEPITPPRRETPIRRLYGNAKATMSMIDLSPRTASLPIFVSPHPSPRNHQRSTSDSPPSPALSMTRKTSCDLSDSGESWDQPVTPSSFSSTGKVGGNGFQFGSAAKAKKAGGGIYGNKSAFLSQLDLGLKRVLEKKDSEDDKKGKRGFGRFLGMK